ncbi:TIGR03899 family protein [Ferrimonas pelagia]|uniref:TIGR03899 family protein n=1 Tax=Ferrimonas pelagia TaxID=1177826 RepID=A0ABP9ELS6_9GAMM
MTEVSALPHPPVPTTGHAKPRSTRHQAVALSRVVGLNTEESGQQASLLHRAEQRQKRQQEQFQLNVEAIVNHAISCTNNSVAGHEPDPDWLHQFLSLSEQIQTPRMQEMWGKILAMELAQPGAFSLRALETLKKMTQRDALLLIRAVALSCTINNESNHKLLIGYRSEPGYAGLLRPRQPQLPLSRFGLPYSAILTLREQGILFAAELETGRLELDKPLRIRFVEQTMLLRPRHARLRLRYYRFTPLGQELARLVQESGDEDYIAALNKLVLRDFQSNRSLD